MQGVKKYLSTGSKGASLKDLDSTKQDLNLYWEDSFADILEIWGEEHVWNEIQLLMINLKGRVLDIACGTGVVIKKLQRNGNLDLYGFDISDLLIKRAISKGIAATQLSVCDATKTFYSDNFFDYSYSIGSLEHFTEDGIGNFISESARYTQIASFHMIPVSKSGLNEGWLKTKQSFHNNSEKWWADQFLLYYDSIHIINSSWRDEISEGKWIICYDKRKKNDIHQING